ncbi:hypothetical protein NUV25_18870 [Burkholderia pseudomultivorans]|uniref:hypothetical protein n=1 Tax=Burkholderia pseudomultivorans TaxID=1207504 RepID=UPI00287441D5|nr:hypothetical protein [Burkholderia pseudomultivorans]MDS0859773.1 hypothetical protein [Burkholderia pseudomultivorans]
MTRTRSGFGRLPFRCTWWAIGLLVVRFAHAPVLPNFTNADVSLVANTISAATDTTIMAPLDIAEKRLPQDGCITLRDDAERWIAAGATSLEEVVRVTGGY